MSKLLLDVFKEDLKMNENYLIPYRSSAFRASSRSHAGQGCCSICGRRQAVMMSQKERGRKAYCDRCAARRNFKKGDHVYAETENGSVPGRIVNRGKPGTTMVVDDGHERFTVEPSRLVLQVETLEEDHGYKAGRRVIDKKSKTVMVVTSVRGNKISCEHPVSRQEKGVFNPDQLDVDFCSFCVRNSDKHVTPSVIIKNGCVDFSNGHCIKRPGWICTKNNARKAMS